MVRGHKPYYPMVGQWKAWKDKKTKEEDHQPQSDNRTLNPK